MSQTLPINFLYLGGDKCGSTWLWHILTRHPNVTLAGAKELFYFDRFYDKGADWYRRQFPTNLNTLRVGEICHDYLYSEKALQRIARDLPDDSRFLVTTRDPIARTISHWRYAVKVGHTKLDFESALKNDPSMIGNSMFGKHVQNAFNYLGRERVSVLDFDLLRKDPHGFALTVCDALQVPFIEDLPYTDRILEAQSARSPVIAGALRNAGWMIRQAGFPKIVSAVKSNPAVSFILYSSKKKEEAISETTKDQLRQMFAADQDLLHELVPSLAGHLQPA